jgi:hypothetical protein
MKYILFISCLLLCSCPFDEEAEPENAPLSSSSSVAVPISSSVEPIEPSILGCPLEDIDIAEYPVSESNPSRPGELPPPGWCPSSVLKLSVEELSFSAQGGVRCITTNSFVDVSGEYELGCYRESVFLFPDGSTFIGREDRGREDIRWRFKKLVCPWFTATAVGVDDWPEGSWRTLHISVNQNETRNERETFVGMSMGDCRSGFKIIQSPN